MSDMLPGKVPSAKAENMKLLAAEAPGASLLLAQVDGACQDPFIMPCGIHRQHSMHQMRAGSGQYLQGTLLP